LNGAVRQSIPVVKVAPHDQLDKLSAAYDDFANQLVNPPTTRDIFAELKSAVAVAVETPAYQRYITDKRAFLSLLDARAKCAVGELTIDETQTIRDWAYLWTVNQNDASIREEREAAYVTAAGRTIATIRKVA
jgi:hypothetical protein